MRVKPKMFRKVGRAGMTFTIETMQRGDWRQVRAILAEGLATGIAAFRTTPPIWRDWNQGHLQVGRFVARNGEGEVAGWVALAPAPDT